MISHKAQLMLPLAAAVALLGQFAISADAADGPTIIQPDAIQWAAAEGLPPGAKIAVLQGDLSKAGPYTVRVDFPAGYEVPTHSHPTGETLTVISGSIRMAFGEKAGAGDAQSLVPGSFMILPGDAFHHIWADAETVVEIHQIGPFGLDLAK